MRIKKLELVGFKSFKDRTVIHFDAGITGVVGPNGCGKSNIVDALVWVMGEMSAKHLRGSSMEDVIFAGADGYAPMGMAEVSLTLENDGGPFPVKYLNHSEIMVTRRLHRSGESEYLINKEVARLRDVQEIFMDTGAGSKGFSIIEQGAIGKIVTAKPEDRRTLIEEAAGITKFKVRKRESQRKLDSTEGNLVRLQDIIGELKRQLESLQRQAQRAERYRKLKQEVEALELWTSSKEFHELKVKTTNAETTYQEARDKEIESTSQMGQMESIVQTLKADIAEFERQITLKQQAAKELNDTIRLKEKLIQELYFEIEQAKRNKEMTGSLTQENRTRRDLLARDLAMVTERLQSLTEQAEKIHTEFSDKKSQFEQFEQTIQAVDQRLTQARKELLTVIQAETTLDARVLNLQESIETLVQEEASAQAVQQELENQKQNIEKNFKRVNEAFDKERQLQLSVMNDVEALLANKNHLAQDLEHRTRELNEYKDRMNEVTSRLYGLEDLQNNFEGFQEGVKSVMLWQRQQLESVPEYDREDSQKFIPVADVVEVPPQYELAMEAALGPRLQLVLSRDAKESVDAIDYLKQQKNGRSSFFSGGLQTVEVASVEPLRADSRVKALLKDVVRIPEKHQSVVEPILDRVAIVNSLLEGIELKKFHQDWTFVTIDGDVITADGIISGGSVEDASSGMLKRQREIKELKTSKDEWASKLSLAQMTLKKVEDSFKKISEDFEKSQRDQTEKEIAVASLKKDLERAEQEFKNANTAQERQQSEIDKITTKLLEKREELERFQLQLSALREKKIVLEQESEELTLKLTHSKNDVQSLQNEVTRLQVEDAKTTQEKEGVQRESNMLKLSLDDVEERLSRMSDETEKSSEFVSQNQLLLEERKIELEVTIRRAQEEEEMVAHVRDSYEQKASELDQYQEDYSAYLTNKSQLQATMNEAQLQLEQARMKEANLVEQIRERYQVELADVYTQHMSKEFSYENPLEELKDLKDKIHKIGEVNLSAIEEYDEISGRYAFLSKQYEDLV